MAAALLTFPSLWSRDSWAGYSPLYSPYSSPSVAEAAQAVNRSSIAALAFLLWDILITTDEEAKLIWPRPWSYTKVNYFFIRYVPLMVEVSILLIGTEITPEFHFTPHDCYIWQVYQGVAVSTILIALDTILILRVHALYHGNIVMRRILAFFFAIEIIGMIVGLTISLPTITYDNLCLVIYAPRTLIIYAYNVTSYRSISIYTKFISSRGSAIIFQAMLFMITLYKFILAVRSGWGDVPLIVLLTRDGTWAFFLLFFTYVGDLVLYALHNADYAGVLFAWLLTVFSFCGYRILLNLNRLANDISGLHPSAITNRGTNTNIQFSTRFNSHHPTTNNSYNLNAQSYRSGARTLQSSHISTLALEP